jgi:hypothetical protein
MPMQVHNFPVVVFDAFDRGATDPVLDERASTAVKENFDRRHVSVRRSQMQGRYTAAAESRFEARGKMVKDGVDELCECAVAGLQF